MTGEQKQRLRLRWFWYALDIVPILLPVAITTFGAVATLLLLCGQLRSSYVWPIGLAVAAIAVGIVVRYYRDVVYEKERRICNVLVGIGILVWGAFNMLFSAQHIITNRDPGTYANAGAWLIHHTSLKIPLPTVFGNVSGLNPTTAGFEPATIHGHTYLYAQGLHLLPIFLGLAGRIVGIRYMFHVNVLFGMTALLAIYALGRLLVRPLWATIATGALAASMPFLYFSRDTYTEPLAATFTFGALALLFLALKTKKPSLWLLVGLVTGAGTLTRIDGFLTIAAMLLFLVIMLATTKASERIKDAKNVIAMLIGIACTATVGWLDLWELSRPYYLGTLSQFWAEIGLIIAILVFGTATVVVCWRTKFLKRLDDVTKNWRAMGAVVAIIGYALILASRPLWTFGHKEFSATAPQWVLWYIGPVLALLGLAGMALVAARVVMQRNLLLLATFLVVLITSLIYITDPSIAPDQVWAARRLVPVILPGIALFGVMAIDWLDQRYGKEIRWRHVFMVFIVIAAILGPLVTSRPDLLDRDTDLYKPMVNVCNALPKNAAVLWIGIASTHLVEPTETICNTPASAYGALLFTMTYYPTVPELAQIAQNARANGHVPVLGLYGSEAAGLLTQGQQANMTTVTNFNFEALTNPVDAPPISVQFNKDTLELGRIQLNGSIEPLTRYVN